jgi:hypothetical protein
VGQILDRVSVNSRLLNVENLFPEPQSLARIGHPLSGKSPPKDTLADDSIRLILN